MIFNLLFACWWYKQAKLPCNLILTFFFLMNEKADVFLSSCDFEIYFSYLPGFHFQGCKISVIEYINGADPLISRKWCFSFTKFLRWLHLDMQNTNHVSKVPGDFPKEMSDLSSILCKLMTLFKFWTCIQNV